MRYKTFSTRLLRLVAAAMLLGTATFHADAQKTDSTNGLNGTINLLAASRGIMDRSYALSRLASLADQIRGLNLRRAGFTIGELRAALASIRRALPPESMAAYSQQMRFGPHRPIFVSGLLLSLNLAGVDFGYQHFEGELEGDGGGVSVSLDPVTYELVEYSIEVSRRFRQFQDTLSSFAKVPDSMEFKNLSQQAQDVIEQAYLKFKGASSRARDSYEDATFGLRVSLGYGYRSLRSGTLETVSLSASWLRPLGRIYQDDHRFDRTPYGLLFLVSAQSLHLATPGFPDRRVERWGLVVALQDRVLDFREERFYRADNRWQWQGGLEVNFKTPLEADHFYGAFLRHRPDKHQEYGLFGGLRDGRNLIFGVQAEWSHL